jgi:hypothetical protein
MRSCLLMWTCCSCHEFGTGPATTLRLYQCSARVGALNNLCVKCNALHSAPLKSAWIWAFFSFPALCVLVATLSNCLRCTKSQHPCWTLCSLPPARIRFSCVDKRAMPLINCKDHLLCSRPCEAVHATTGCHYSSMDAESTLLESASEVSDS